MKTNKIVHIDFPLAFYLPIEDEVKIVSHYEKFASFKFACMKYKNDSFKSVGEIEEFCTKISFDFLFDFEEEIEEIDLLRKAIFHSTTYLNNFLDAFRLVNNFEFIPNFTITDLPPTIDVKIEEKQILYITAPTKIGIDKIPLLEEQLKKTQQRLSSWNNNLYFEVIDKFQSKAIHHLHTEDFLSAIIELQTSFEAYIRLCHYLILISQGADDSKIEAAKEYPLKNTIVDHIGRALGEDFNFERNLIINCWYENLYNLRNKIVHSGLSYITGNEAYSAYDSFVEIVIYINSLMTKNGIMSNDGQIEVSKLNKNIEGLIDSELVIEKLINKGLIEKNYT